ncbi:MAG: NYN domain-containing protein [Fuscovulum sp.]|nr:MAG: NYN domain-containing protein [Fuscovulum sp.]
MVDTLDGVAVLVDGENVSSKHAAAILRVAQSIGVPQVVRVYLDARSGSGWHNVNGYRLIHTGVGKNVTDMFLAVDAIELRLAKSMRQFVLVSSDRDFSHLVIRLRENGARVTGLGEKKTSEAFRAICDTFVELEEKTTSTKAVVTRSIVLDMDKKIRDVIKGSSSDAQGMRISELAPKMHLKHGVKISTLPEKTWRGYLGARPHLFELDPRGADARVRCLPEGFRQS